MEYNLTLSAGINSFIEMVFPDLETALAHVKTRNVTCLEEDEEYPGCYDMLDPKSGAYSLEPVGFTANKEQNIR